MQVAEFGINNGVIHFRDAQPAGGFKTEITGIDAIVKNFTTASDKSADYQLSLLMDHETGFAAEGRFSLTPMSVTATILAVAVLRRKIYRSFNRSAQKWRKIWP